MSDWRIYTGAETGKRTKKAFPKPPAWRVPGSKRDEVLAATFRPTEPLIDAVNAAIYLRRPLLVTGKPGTGKSSLIYAVAKELDLGPVLKWSISSKTVLRDGFDSYDALARLQDIQLQKEKRGAKARTGGRGAGSLRKFLRLGPLGSALASENAPRALLVDEIDKSDVDLPNDLLDVLDTGRFEIPELQRLGENHVEMIETIERELVTIRGGVVTFAEYPLVVMTSNGERDFPGPFLRRCVQFEMAEPDPADLVRIVGAHFPHLLDKKGKLPERVSALIAKFVEKRKEMALSTDQVLNAAQMTHNSGHEFDPEQEAELLKTIFQKLG